LSDHITTQRRIAPTRFEFPEAPQHRAVGATSSLPGVDFVHSIEAPTGTPLDTVFLEVVTRNHTYLENVAFICVEIVDRTSGVRSSHGGLCGARLMGGRVCREDGTLETMSPFPIPGAMALFAQPRRLHDWVSTSPVERVIVHVRRGVF
jgi:hypothetical protein